MIHLTIIKLKYIDLFYVFSYEITHRNYHNIFYYRILKENSKIMLLRSLGIISELKAFSKDLGRGEFTVVAGIFSIIFVKAPECAL